MNIIKKNVPVLRSVPTLSKPTLSKLQSMQEKAMPSWNSCSKCKREMTLKDQSLKGSSIDHAFQLKFKKLLWSLGHRTMLTIICTDTKIPLPSSVLIWSMISYHTSPNDRVKQMKEVVQNSSGLCKASYEETYKTSGWLFTSWLYLDDIF